MKTHSDEGYPHQPGRRPIKRSLIWFSALTALTLAACDGQPAGAPGGDEPSGGGRAVPVQLAEVEAARLEETVGGIGSLQALEAVALRPEMAGTLEQVAAPEGGPVEAGQILFTIDDALLQRRLRSTRAALEAARARRTNAEQSFRRAEDLLDRKAISQAAHEQARAARDTAAAEIDRLQAQIDLIREQIADTRISAPFAGSLSEPLVDAGSWVRAGQDLAMLYRSGGLEIAFSVPSRHAHRLAIGQTVRISPGDGPGRTFEGRLSYIAPEVDTASRGLQLKASLSTAPALRPGRFVTARVVVAVHEDRPVIPAEALVGTRTGYIVFVVDDDLVAHKRAVEIGLREAGRVEIAEGLQVGERVVRQGHMRVDDGSRVRTGNAESAP